MRRLALLLLVALVMLTACIRTGDEPADADPNRLRLQVSGEPEETQVYESIALAFEQRNPEVDVEVVPVASKGDHLARLSTSFASGNPPDVFLVNFREYAQFVARGAIEPVEPYLEPRNVVLQRYYRPPVEAFTYDGALQCMPQNISSLVVYYNRALFERAGVDEPPDAWEWADFVDTAQELDRKKVDGVGIDPNVIRLAPFVWSDGGEVVDDLDEPTTLTMGARPTRRVVADVVDLVRSAAPDEEAVSAQDLETRFTTGKLAMFLSSRREVPVFREVSGLDFDVAPLPAYGASATTILHSDAYCMARSSERHDLAADFVAFATGPTGQSLGALSGRTVPSLRSAAESPAFLDPGQPPARSQVFLDGIDVMRRTPVHPSWPEVEDLAEETLTRAFYDTDVPLRERLRELDEASRALFERGT